MRKLTVILRPGRRVTVRWTRKGGLAGTILRHRGHDRHDDYYDVTLDMTPDLIHQAGRSLLLPIRTDRWGGKGPRPRPAMGPLPAIARFLQPLPEQDGITRP